MMLFFWGGHLLALASVWIRGGHLGYVDCIGKANCDSRCTRIHESRDCEQIEFGGTDRAELFERDLCKDKSQEPRRVGDARGERGVD